LSSTSRLYRHRWSLPILEQLALSGGSRFVVLANKLGISRDALRQTLDVLIDEGLVMRNPGYGHPARPEYILTKKGKSVAPLCTRLLKELRRRGLEELGLRRWSLPILTALSSESRYAELREALGATPRALTLALKELVARGVVERHVHAGYPPSTTYRVAKANGPLRGQAARLASAL
jgi:DNA-binding HxlR family transcriptional regulator